MQVTPLDWNIMSDKSPLFVSANELLAHAIELYMDGNERKFKFVILHLANSVELILKDRLIDKGISIYIPKQQQTIGIWKSFEELETLNINIIERPVIELLIDDRNTIQHRFGFPNAETVYYYLEQIIEFFKRFLSEQYNVALVDVLKLYLNDSALSLFGLITSDKDEYSALDTLFKLSPESAVLQAYNLIESKFFDFQNASIPRGQSLCLSNSLSHEFFELMNALAKKNLIAPDTPIKFHTLRDMRNRAAHSAPETGSISNPKWIEALEIAKDVLRGLTEANKIDLK